MNSSELIKKLAKRCEITEELASDVLSEMVDIISECVANDEEVKIWKLGKFIRRKYNTRKCYNPIKDKVEEIEQSYVPVFKAGPKFRNFINK